MKKYILLLVILINQPAYSAFITGFEITPGTPNTNDFIVANIFTQYSNSGYTIPTEVVASVSNNSIMINDYML